MRFYDVIVFVHVLSAVTLVGGGILATPTINTAIRRARTTEDLRRWLAVGKPLSVVNPISSITLLASGAYLSSMSHWWGAAWVQVAVVLWIANAALANAVVNPSMKALARLAFASQDYLVGPELERLQGSPRTALTHQVMTANDVGVLFLMVTKPTGYLVAVLVVVATQLILLPAVARHRRTGAGEEKPTVPLEA